LLLECIDAVLFHADLAGVVLVESALQFALFVSTATHIFKGRGACTAETDLLNGTLTDAARFDSK